jgi:hypothetical protein
MHHIARWEEMSKATYPSFFMKYLSEGRKKVAL